MTTLKRIGLATLDVLGRGAMGFAGFVVGGNLTHLVTGDLNTAIAGGVGGALALLVAGRVMDRDEAALDARIAADREAYLEGRVADLQRYLDEVRADNGRLSAQLVERMEAETARMTADCDRLLAEMNGDLETVGSGEVDELPPSVLAQMERLKDRYAVEYPVVDNDPFALEIDDSDPFGDQERIEEEFSDEFELSLQGEPVVTVDADRARKLRMQYERGVISEAELVDLLAGR
jgi:hypothetical protein